MPRRFKPDTSLIAIERPGRYIGREFNAALPKPDADFRFCLLFPDIYDIGISYHGFSILYHILNRIEGVSCERAYLPWFDMQSRMEHQGLALFSMEGRRPLGEFNAIGITLQTELHYPGIVKALHLAGISIYASDRGIKDPLIIGGGPCAFHPEPIAPFFDAFLLGDGEEALPELIQLMRCAEFKRAGRREKWNALTRVDGVYVPGLYDRAPPFDSPPGNRGGSSEIISPAERGGSSEIYPPPVSGGGIKGGGCADNLTSSIIERGIKGGSSASKIRARVATSLRPEYYPSNPIVPMITGTHDRLTVEIMRGCSRGCRFCQAGMLHRPVRERPVSEIVDQVMAGIAATGWDEVGLLSLSTSDYSRLEELLGSLAVNLAGKHVSIAFPSLHPTTFSEEMARLETGGRKSGLTFAVEAGSKRLRNVINKGLDEEVLVEAIERAYRNGWRVVKLYFMVGLPTEQLDDIDHGAELLDRLQRMIPRHKELHVSVAPFIPKPHSVFQCEEFLSIETLRERIRRMLRYVKRRYVKTTWHDPEMSCIETVLARGNREMAAIIEEIAATGKGLEAWSGMFSAERWMRALNSNYPSWSNLLKPLSETQTLNWSHLSKGYSKRFFRNEIKAARQSDPLPDCRTEECYKCGLTKTCDRVAAEAGKTDDKSEALTATLVSHALQRQKSNKNNTGYRYRLTFTKLSGARFLGHLDLMKSVIRSLLRAGFPFLYTRGFNPRPKVSYGPALPLGYGASKLWLEFEVTSRLNESDWLKRLQSVIVSGVRPLSIETVPKDARSDIEQADFHVYRLRFNRQVLTDDSKAGEAVSRIPELINLSPDIYGRTLTLWMRNEKGKKLDPLEIGLEIANDSKGVSDLDLKIVSVTKME